MRYLAGAMWFIAGLILGRVWWALCDWARERRILRAEKGKR